MLHSKFIRNLSYIILFLSLIVIGFMIFVDLNWVLGDDDLFLKTTMIGCPSHAWTGQGRFWPLGLCDYSILLLLPAKIGQTIEAHYGYNLVILSISVFLLYHLFNKVNQKNYGLSLLFVFVLFCLSSFMQIHMSCIYPERFMFFVQLMFLYFWWRGYERQSVSSYLIAWFFCTYCIFCKEPVFGTILVIALFNLIFGYKQLTSKDCWFQVEIIFSSLVYLGIYIYRMFYRDLSTVTYGGGNIFHRGSEAISIIGQLFVNEPILVLIFMFALVRCYYVLVKGDRRAVFADGLLFGSVAYVVSYMILAMNFAYYVFPAIVFALPAMVYWTEYLWSKSKFKWFVVVLLFAGSSYVSSNASIKYMSNTYDLRNNDMKVVEYITNSYIKGKYIYIFMNGQPLEKFTISAVHGNIWEFDVFTHFTNYMLYKRNYLRGRNILRPLEKLEYLFDDSIVLCPTSMDQKHKDYLNSRGFSLKYTAFSTDVYSK